VVDDTGFDLARETRGHCALCKCARLNMALSV